MAELLRDHFPGLLPCYRKILFHEPTRADYLRGLRARVDRAARRASVADRVGSCL